jgi:hypothetical protein
MNSNLKKIGVGIATVIAGTALFLTSISADAGVDTHVERSCFGTPFDVVCFVRQLPTNSAAD